MVSRSLDQAFLYFAVWSCGSTAEDNDLQVLRHEDSPSRGCTAHDSAALRGDGVQGPSLSSTLQVYAREQHQLELLHRRSAAAARLAKLPQNDSAAAWIDADGSMKQSPPDAAP